MAIKHVAILSAGPSLVASWQSRERETYDCKIAVNGAIESPEIGDVDYWCFLDPHTAHVMLPAVRASAVYCAYESIVQIRRGDTPLGAMIPAINAQDVSAKHVGQRFCYSITFAIALAGDIGADSIDIFGADMVGGNHCNGVHDDQSTVERWAAGDRPGQAELLGELEGRIVSSDERITRWQRELVEITSMQRRIGIPMRRL